jgi:hypothetical protein
MGYVSVLICLCATDKDPTHKEKAGQGDMADRRTRREAGSCRTGQESPCTSGERVS